MTDDRRTFLQRLSLGGLALSALPAPLSAAIAAPRPSEVSPTSVADELLALRSTDDPPPFDVAWAERLTGKHRAVFDVPEIEGGSGVWRAGLWVDHVTQLLKAAPADIQPVLVIRHAAIPLIMKQEFWARYDVAKDLDVRHPMTDKRTKRNPVLMTADEDGLAPMLARLTLDAQMARGTIVLACNMAFQRMLRSVAAKDKVTPAAARARALELMLPGVIFQPNGIFGVTLAQEHGCTFVQAS